MQDALLISQIIMEDALIFLIIILAIFIIIIGVPLHALITDAKDLIKTAKTLCDTVQNELEPTLNEAKKALESVNALATGVDKNVNAFKSSFSNAYGIAFNAASKIKGLSSSFLGGVITALKLFFKK